MPACLVLLLLGALVGPVRGQLILNGSFEQGPQPGLFSQHCPPSAAIEGWVVIHDCIDYCGTIWEPGEGLRSLDLDARDGDAGGVSQTVATTLGSCYRVRWKMAGNPESGPIIKRMIVAAAGQQVEHTFDITGRTLLDMGWTERAWQFVAEGTMTTLEFYSVTVPPGFGPALDDVRVTLVGCCAADFNGDGAVTVQDFLAYLSAYAAGEARADINGDGQVNVQDFLAYLSAYSAGCA